MRLLITGSKGFTGIHLVALATQQGYVVHDLQADLTNFNEIKAEILDLQPTHVIHLGAISHVQSDPHALYTVNTLGTLNLLLGLLELKSKPSKVLLASTGNVYGNTLLSPILESTIPQPVNHYGVSKLAMEYAALLYTHTLPIVIARPFNYTGVGQSATFVIPKLVNYFANRSKTVELGNINVEREFNDVRYVCAAYLDLLLHSKNGETYNVCTQQPHTLQSVINTLTELTQHSPIISVNPEFIRPNELHILCGSAAKLRAACTNLPNISLSDTLTWMLNSHSAAKN